LILQVSLCFIGLISLGSAVRDECHLRELDLCLAPLTLFAQPPTGNDKQDLDKRCASATEVIDCIHTYTDNCVPEGMEELAQYFVSSSDQFERQLCEENSTFRKLYKKYSPCMRDIFQEQRKCYNDFSVAMENVVDSPSINDKRGLTCCAFHRMHDCSNALLLEKCGQEAVDFSAQLEKQIFSRLPEMICSAFDVEDELCNRLTAPGTSESRGKKKSVIGRIFSAFHNTGYGQVG